MNAREAILAAVRLNLPGPAVPLPDVHVTDRRGIKHGLGYKEHFHITPSPTSFRTTECGRVRSRAWPLG